MAAVAMERTLPSCAAALAVVPKGRLLTQSQELFARAGVDAPRFSGRRLETSVAAGRFILARGRDVPLYVRTGAAELGVVGRDVLLEEPEDLVEVADLGFGRCRLVFAAPDGLDLGRADLRVASRYPALTTRYLRGRGIEARVVALAGAVEGSVGAGLAHAIVDVVETGATLRAHNLTVLDTVAESSARLVAAAGSTLSPRARDLARRLSEVVSCGG